MARALRVDKKILIRTPMDRAYEAIATAKGLKGWYADDVSSDPVEGELLDFTWGKGAASHKSKARVLRVYPGKGVMLRWEDIRAHSRDDYFSISLKKAGKSVGVEIVDFATKDTRDEVDEIWDECLDKLKQRLESS